MNMMSTIERAPEIDTRKLFRDENGEPSERSGPDLTKAEPIDEVIARLCRAGSTHAQEFYFACSASGIDLSVHVSRDGEECIRVGCPMDSQEELRRPRHEALIAHMKSTEKRRQGVIDFLNTVGRFLDERPFESVEEAAEAFISTGGWIFARPGHPVEWTMPRDAAADDAAKGFPVRRLVQRFSATVWRQEARDELADLVQERGVIHEGSGAYVWAAAEQEARS